MVNGLTKLWNKTIFPEMIKKGREKKQEEQQLRDELRKEILTENRDEIKNAMKEQILKDEVEKLKGGNTFGSKMQKLGEKMAKGFESNTGFANKDKMNEMLGKNSSNNSNTQTSGGFMNSDKISNMLGGSRKQMDNIGDKDLVNLMDGRKKKLSGDEIVGMSQIHKGKKNAVTKEDKIKQMMKL